MYIFLNNTGLINISYAYYYSLQGYSMGIRSPTPPLLSGITSLLTQNATTYFSVTGADTANVLATYSSYAAVLQKSIGSGSLVILGIDFYEYDSTWAEIISRAATGTANTLPSWLSLSPDSGTVAVAQCAAAGFHFNAASLASGVYTAQVLISHNSPFSQSPIAVSCTLVVPQTTMTYTPGSYRITLNTGDTVSRTLTINNTGASNLSYAIRGSAAGWLSLGSNPTGNVSAGGNAAVSLKFNAGSMIYSGTYIDSLLITHNASNYADPFAVRCTLVVVSTIPALVHFTPNPTSIRRPKLVWHSVASSTSYTIQIASDVTFSSPILVQPTTDTFYLPLVDLPLGPVYWKVKSSLNSTYCLPDAFCHPKRFHSEHHSGRSRHHRHPPPRAGLEQNRGSGRLPVADRHDGQFCQSMAVHPSERYLLLSVGQLAFRKNLLEGEQLQL